MADRTPATVEASPEVEDARAEVDRLRQLASMNPDAHLAALAEALYALGSSLIEPSPPEALQPAQEAVEIYRQLAARDPAKYRTGLAFTLDFVSTVLMMLGRCSESLELTEQAAAIFRDLVEDDPALLERYAMILGSVAHLLRAMGRNTEAMDIALKRVAICRTLADERRDGNLALGLLQLCGALAANGQVGECLRAARETLMVWQQLAAKDPTQTVEDAAEGIALDLALLGRIEAFGVLHLAREIQRSALRTKPLLDRLIYWWQEAQRETNLFVLLVLNGMRARVLWALADGPWDGVSARLAWMPPVRWADRRLRSYLKDRPRDLHHLACRDAERPDRHLTQR